MKGFARIFEAIIASIIIIASLTFFITLESPGTGWDAVNLQTISQDTLRAVYINGTLATMIRMNDKASLANGISSILPKTADFSIRVKNIPNDIIRIACVGCTVGEINDLADMINETEFDYHKRRISIRVETLDLSIEDIKEDTNVLFFFNKNKLAGNETKVSRFVTRGGSVFLLSTLTSGDVSGYIGQMFNLSWSDPSQAQTPAFYDVTNGQNVSHYIAKYYANISGRYLADVQADTFGAFSSTGVIRKNDQKDVAIGTTKSYARANMNINITGGRSIWFSEYTRNNPNDPETKKINKLLKAALMWVSGESYSMDVVKKTPAPVRFISEIMLFNEDAYTVELTVWYAFF